MPALGRIWAVRVSGFCPLSVKALLQLPGCPVLSATCFSCSMPGCHFLPLKAPKGLNAVYAAKSLWMETHDLSHHPLKDLKQSGEALGWCCPAWFAGRWKQKPPKAPPHEIMGAELQGFTPSLCSCAAVWIFFLENKHGQAVR